MKKIIFGILMTFLVFNNLDVSAIENCTDSEMERLKELANNVQLKTRYEMSTNEETIDEDVYKSVSLIYGIDIINFDKDLKIVYENGEETENLNYKTDSVEALSEGSKLKFSIYSYTTNKCTDNLLRTITIELPYYNDYYYYNKNKCIEHQDFKYCKEFLNTSDITFSEIDELYDDYLKEDNIINKITKDSKFIYIISGIGILAIISIVIVIKNNKNKRKKKDDL